MTKQSTPVVLVTAAVLLPCLVSCSSNGDATGDGTPPGEVPSTLTNTSTDENTSENTVTAPTEENTPADTEITGGPEVATSFPVTFTFAGTDREDAVSDLTYAYALDDEEWSSWQSEGTANFDFIENGTHVFHVKARDTEDMEDETPATWEFDVELEVDLEAPDTEITEGPSGQIHTPTATFEFTGSDDETPTEELVYSYRMDGGDWSEFSASTTVTYKDLAEGSHTFQVLARDENENADPSPATRTFSVSLGPYCDIEITPPSASEYGDAGADIGFQVDFENTGTQTCCYDFDLVKSLPIYWIAFYCGSDDTCFLGPTTLCYDQEESDYMVIHIVSSAYALPGETGNATLTVACDDGSCDKDSAATLVVN